MNKSRQAATSFTKSKLKCQTSTASHKKKGGRVQGWKEEKGCGGEKEGGEEGKEGVKAKGRMGGRVEGQKVGGE